MAVTYLQAGQLSVSAQFLFRMQTILGKYAKFCISTSALPAGSTNSKALAARIQSDPVGMTAKITMSFVSDTNVLAATTTGTGATMDLTSATTDTNLNTWVENVWNSGVWDNIA